ncbi:unnamed protein product, partial [Musa textilis]
LSGYGRGGLLSVGREAGRSKMQRETELLEYGRGFCRLGGEEGGGGGRRRGCQDPRTGRRSKASNQRIKTKNRSHRVGIHMQHFTKGEQRTGCVGEPIPEMEKENVTPRKQLGDSQGR